MSKILRTLSFRLRSDEYAALGWRDAGLGLALAWLAGVGRYWDHARAGAAQKSGLGSVFYVLCLAALIWLLLRPFRLQRRNYSTVVAVVGFTSPLAWLYALPVERWMELESAMRLNLWFLAVVAVLRVLLYARFLRVGAAYSWFGTLVLTLMPLTLVVATLFALDLENAALNLMAGIDRADPSRAVAQQTSMMLLNLTGFSLYAALPLLGGYAWLVTGEQIHRASLKEQKPADQGPTDGAG
jgi:hypothetical protein